MLQPLENILGWTGQPPAVSLKALIHAWTSSGLGHSLDLFQAQVLSFSSLNRTNSELMVGVDNREP